MKDYFYFSNGQKIGILVLLSLIVLVITITELLPHLIKDKPKDHKKYVEAAQELADRLLSFALSAALYPCPIDEVDILSEALHVALPRSDDTSLVKFAIRREIVERWERVV